MNKKTNKILLLYGKHMKTYNIQILTSKTKYFIVSKRAYKTATNNK